MKFWPRFLILPVMSPPSKSHTSTESTYWRRKTSMKGRQTCRSMNHIWSYLCQHCVCVCVRSGRRGFRRLKRRLRNLLRLKRKKGKKLIKVCFTLFSHVASCECGCWLESLCSPIHKSQRHRQTSGHNLGGHWAQGNSFKWWVCEFLTNRISHIYASTVWIWFIQR